MRWVLITDPHEQFGPQSLVSTTPAATRAQIVEWFVQSWQLEVTFEEAHAHLGVFSLVTVLAHQLLQGQDLPARQAAWYTKALPTLADTLAFVRQHLWPVTISWISPDNPEAVQIPKALLDRLTDALAFAA